MNLKCMGKVLRFKKQILNGNFIFRENGSKILGSLLNQQIKRYWPELITVIVLKFPTSYLPPKGPDKQGKPRRSSLIRVFPDCYSD